MSVSPLQTSMPPTPGSRFGGDSQDVPGRADGLKDWNIVLDDNVVRNMDMGAVFDKENKAKINSLDFHRSAELLVTASDDDSINVYDTCGGSHLKTLFSRKYGCHSVSFTHHTNAVLAASSKGDDHSVKYLSLHDNRWLRYFAGHNGKVTGLAVSPKDDLFLSTGVDREVRLWDLRINHCQGVLRVPSQPVATFDQQGLVFAAAADCGIIKLYDMRAYDKGPFDTFVLEEENCGQVPFGSLMFSNDGQKILAVVESRVYVLDAFKGHSAHRFDSGVPEGGTPLGAAFSPDAKYVVSGCHDRKIRVWSCKSGLEVAAWEGHAGVPTTLKWSLTRCLVASACSALAFWIPDMQRISDYGGFAGRPDGQRPGAPEYQRP
ncbi:hypothetical protein BSKO_09037 [Bryopsis sp. KO-2023]|nr:hypothetical protein BSKO_09037 [Bryopsis sp. KO-2023]